MKMLPFLFSAASSPPAAAYCGYAFVPAGVAFGPLLPWVAQTLHVSLLRQRTQYCCPGSQGGPFAIVY
jgi:hypothetical protein